MGQVSVLFWNIHQGKPAHIEKCKYSPVNLPWQSGGICKYVIHVFTEQLKYRLAEKCPKIVRVYSEMLENQVFPIPRDYVVSNVRGRK